MGDTVDPVQGTGQGVSPGCEPEEADDPVYVDEEDWSLPLRGLLQSFVLLCAGSQ
jgi:hypothetical protein